MMDPIFLSLAIVAALGAILYWGITLFLWLWQPEWREALFYAFNPTIRPMPHWVYRSQDQKKGGDAYTESHMRAEIRAAVASERAKIVAMVRSIRTTAGPEAEAIIAFIAECVETADWEKIAAAREEAASNGMSPLMRQMKRVKAERAAKGGDA